MSSDDVALCFEKTKSLKPLTVFGTIKLHVVVGSGGIKYCNMSGYFSNCFKNAMLWLIPPKARL